MWPVVERLQPLGLFQLLSSVWLRLPLALWLAHGLVTLAAEPNCLAARVPIWSRLPSESVCGYRLAGHVS